jgi:methionyl-tRNA formyltransferase
VTYAHKIDKAEAAIDWNAAATVIERRLRAFDPHPGCTTAIAGHAVKAWRGRVVPGAGVPGQVLQAAQGRLVVACGEGALELLELQRPGARRIPAREFLQQLAVAAG